MKHNPFENLTISNIKCMTVGELDQLAKDIRKALIHNISNSGGHLASNLGVVELTIAIHKVFSSPKDNIIFDVGHQCYVHKMLTGRYANFTSLRKKDGLSGFPNPLESEHDIFKTGHSSTSISSALGIATAMELQGDKDSSVVAVIGDGSMTGGLAFEGLNNAGNSGKNLVIILNDNKMSISNNVGAISKALTKLRNQSGYFITKDAFGAFISKIPFAGKGLYSTLNKLKTAVKSYFYKSNIFEDIGFNYIGPVDGHDIELLTRVLTRAKSLKRPVIVHVNTVKGKGYSYAENNPRAFHGVGGFDIFTGNSVNVSQLTFTDVFGQAIVKQAKQNNAICAITAAMGSSCGLSSFKESFPNRYFDVGIAEQHAVTFASGLAKKNMLPIFAVYSTFLQRSYDQIIHDISLQGLKMIFAIDRAGIVGEDGETHQGLFDIPMLLPIPNINIFAPSTGTELNDMLDRAIRIEKNTSAIRYPRGNCVEYVNYPFKKSIGNWDCINFGSNIAIVSYGREIIQVLDACKGLHIDIYKLNLINKFDNDFINEITKYATVFFVEECYSLGGVGMLLQSFLSNSNFNGKFIKIAIKNSFIAHATQKEILNEYKLDSNSIKEAVLKEIENR